MSIDNGALAPAQLLYLHGRAQDLVDASLANLPAGALGLATPCADWTLGGLLRHVLGQNRGLAAAARGGGRDLTDWRPRVLGRDAAQDIAESAAAVVAGFAERGLDGTVWMPEISPSAPIPARVALLAHLVDTVVHGWDVAASLGLDYDVPPDILAAAASVADAVPDGANRVQRDTAGPAPAFAPALRLPAGADPLDNLLAHLGRDPRWTPSARSG